MSVRLHNYASYNVRSLADFTAVAKLFGDDWFFRGHAKSEWDLCTTMERDACRLERKDFAAFEAFSLEQIKRRAVENKDVPKPVPDDAFSWLALLQHHGCKTRLVDFTRSIQVALFFAFSDRPDEHDFCDHSFAAIWAVRKSDLEVKIRSLAPTTGSKGEPEAISRSLVQSAICNPTRRKSKTAADLAVVFSTPAAPNQRMLAQEGLFLAPLNLQRPFKENLTEGFALTGTKEPIVKLKDIDELKAALGDQSFVKLRLPKALRKPMLSYLQRRQITEATLFPDFDGFVHSLNFHTALRGGGKV